MNIATLKKVLPTIPAEQTVMLKGCHGIGKTEVVRWIAKNIWHQECIEFQASQISDVGDLIGLPRINAETGHTEWVPPFWYKKDEKGNPIPVTLFLDELNRGTTLVTNAMMQLGLDHKILNFQLAEGSHVICAINPGDDGTYDVEEFDPAKADRFVTYTFKPSTAEWLEWAVESGINPLITGYISQYGSDLDPYSNAENAKTTSRSFDGILPSRRSWVRFSKFLDAGLENHLFEGTEGVGILEESCSGYVGKAIAAKFKTYFMQHGNGLDAKALMESKNFEKEFAKKVTTLCKKSKVDAIGLGRSVTTYLFEQQNNYLGKDGKLTDVCKKYGKNFYDFLSALSPELRVEVYTNCVETATHNENMTWVRNIGLAYPKLRDMYLSIVDIQNEVG